MSDLVERLRHCADTCGDEYLHELAGRAAAEIERLRAALREIAEVGFVRAKDASAMHDEAIKIARAALEERT